jgi:LmbE family N-acetylglucosaminyl deacetylase
MSQMFGPQDRVLILAPHPDDETLCTGGIIQQALALGLPIHVVFLTYGDNNEWSFVKYRKKVTVGSKAVEGMGLVRHGEAVKATGVLGLKPEQLSFLGYPDFGTLQIWEKHWGARPTFRSMFGRMTAVAYPNAYRPGAEYRGDDVLKDLTAIIGDFKPTKIFLSHPADHNPDHQALYLFTRVALWNLAADPHPELYPFLVHYPKWPRHQGLNPTWQLNPPSELADLIPWQSNPLIPDATQAKITAIQCHATQYAVSEKFLKSFLRSNELFGDYPPSQLGSGASGGVQESGREEGVMRVPEALTGSQKAKFVGVESRSLRLDGDRVVIAIDFSGLLSGGVEAEISTFGYRFDRPFAEMPKILIKFSEVGLDVFDRGEKLAGRPVAVERRTKHIAIGVPLALLGDPEKLLGSVSTSMHEYPLDSAPWRVVDLGG